MISKKAILILAAVCAVLVMAFTVVGAGYAAGHSAPALHAKPHVRPYVKPHVKPPVKPHVKPPVKPPVKPHVKPPVKPHVKP